VRSSDSGSVGDEGPAERVLRDDLRDGRGESCGEVPLVFVVEGWRCGEVCCLLGCGGCWRIRRRPVSAFGESRGDLWTI
jgi:hypothetical protein